MEYCSAGSVSDMMRLCSTVLNEMQVCGGRLSRCAYRVLLL